MAKLAEPVLAITPENDTAHIGTSTILLPHVLAEEGAAQPGRAVQWEYYDSLGQPLVVRDRANGKKVLAVADTAASLPPRAVRRALVARVQLALAHAQLRLDASFVGKAQPGDRDLTQIVQVAGDLSDVLVMLSALEALDPKPGGPHPGSPLHNWLDILFG